jgi:hypothetical protein
MTLATTRRVAMMRIARRVGIAIGSVVIAYLAIALVAGMLLGPAGSRSPGTVVVTLVLGGAIYLDIVRREHRSGPTS